MQQQGPTTYTNITKEDFTAIKLALKAHGMNISGNTDNVEFDRIPLRVDYTPEEKKLVFTITEPHWLAPGTTAGALHTIIAGVVDGPDVPRENENVNYRTQKNAAAATSGDSEARRELQSDAEKKVAGEKAKDDHGKAHKDSAKDLHKGSVKK